MYLQRFPSKMLSICSMVAFGCSCRKECSCITMPGLRGSTQDIDQKYSRNLKPAISTLGSSISSQFNLDWVVVWLEMKCHPKNCQMEGFGFQTLTFAPSPSTVVTFHPEQRGTGERHWGEKITTMTPQYMGTLRHGKKCTSETRAFGDIYTSNHCY